MPYENNIVIIPTVSQDNTQKHPIAPNAMSSKQNQCEAKGTSSNQRATSVVPVSVKMANVSIPSTNQCKTTVVPISVKNANISGTNQCESSVQPVIVKAPNARGIPMEVSKITSQETLKHISKKNSKDKEEIAGTNKFSASDAKNKKKSCASWASNYLQSIGQCSKLINKEAIKQHKLQSASTDKQKDTTDKKNGSQQIKLNLLPREKPNKNAGFKTNTGNINAGTKNKMGTKTSKDDPQTFANQPWIPHQTNTINTNHFRTQTDTEWYAQQSLVNTMHLHNSNFYTNNIITTVPEKQSAYTFRHYYTPSYMSSKDYTWLTHESYANTAYQPTALQYVQPNYQNEIKESKKQSSQVNETIGTSSQKSSKSHQDTKSSSSNKDKTASAIVSTNKENHHQNKKHKNISTESTKRSVVGAKTKQEPKCKEKSSVKPDRKNLDSKIKNTVDKMRKFSSSVKNSVESLKEKTTKTKQVKKQGETKELKMDKNEKYISKKRSRSPDQPSKKRVRKEDTSLKKTKLNHTSTSKLEEKPLRQKQGQEVRSNSKIIKEVKDEKLNRNRGCKDEVSKRPERIEKRPELSKKRVRRDSSSELQPNKRICSISKKETTSKKISPMKSVVKLPKNSEIKHPRIQAPENEESDNDDIASHFDLRSKLSRLNYENCLGNKKLYENNPDSSITERENLVISVNTQPIPGPSKLNKKDKKYKQIQLVINVICKDQEDSSDNSSSDENDSKPKDIIVESESQTKPDLSFLDDINIDEIVNSLKNDANTQKNMKQMVFESSKKLDKPLKKFVQPIAIKPEIKAEPIEPNILNNDESCLSSPKVHEIILDDEDTLSLGSLNNDMNEQSIENIQNAVDEIANRIVIGNIKQENQISEAGNSLKENTDILNTSNQNEFTKSIIHKNKEVSDLTLIQNIKRENFEDNSITSNHDNENTEQLQKSFSDEKAIKAANNFKLLKIAQPFIDVSRIEVDLINIKSEPCDVNQEMESRDIIIRDIQNASGILHKKPTNEWTDRETLDSGNGCELVECEKTVDNTYFKVTANNELIQEENNNDVINMEKVIKERNVEKFTQNVSETTKVNAKERKTQESSIKNIADTNEDKRETTVISALKSDKVTEKKSVIAEKSTGEFKNNEVTTNIKEELCDDTNMETSTKSISKSTVSNTYSEHNPLVEAHINIENKSEKVLAKDTKKIAENSYTKTIQPSLHLDNVILESKSAQHLMNKPSSPTVKSNNIIGEILIGNNKPPTKTIIDTTFDSKPGPSSKSEVIARPETEEQIIPCNSSAIPNTTIDHKTKEVPENAKTDKERTVTIMQPSLKSDKVLALKIEERILEYLKLNMSVISFIHMGKFSKIFKCKDAENQHFALKVILDKKTRFSNGIDKEKMLFKLQEDIPRANLNTIYFISGFGLQRNWCFLLEYYPKNLRQALLETVFNIDTVRGLARQLVSAVMVMRNNDIVHSDIKPSHILLDTSNTKLKVCGFDEAYNIAEKRVILPNLGSSFYRAPEVILGYSVGFGIDVWATALVIYEMAAGKKLFNGFLTFNNNMLFYQMFLLGYVPYDMIQNSRYAKHHFLGTAFKKITGKGPTQFVQYNMQNFNRKTEIFDILMPICSERWAKLKNNRWRKFLEDMKKLANLCQLLDKMLVMDPRQRIPIEFVCADIFFMDKNGPMPALTEQF